MTTETADAGPTVGPWRRLDAVLGGPVWWGAHLSAMYWLVPRTCEWGTTWPLHVVTLLFAGLCSRAGLSAVQTMRAGRAAGSRDAGPRDVYLGWTGLALAVVFGTVVVAEWLPTLTVGPCL